MTYRNNATIKEKAAQLVEDRRNSTLLGRSQLDLMELGGRYTRPSQVVAGEGALTYPKAADWCASDPGLEPPLGYDINDQPPTGEVHEVNKSLARLSSSLASGSANTAVHLASSSVSAEAGSLVAHKAPSGLPASPQPNIWRRPI